MRKRTASFLLSGYLILLYTEKMKKSIFEDRKAMGNQDTTVLIYQAEDGHTKVDVRFEDDTVWL